MDARGERILSDVNLAFKRDPAIDEYDYLPVHRATQNRSPVTLIEHKLGMEMWSIKVLFQHAYTKLLAWRNREPTYKYLEPHQIVCLTRAVVMINPDCCTAWNVRKELIMSGDLKPRDCLKLGALILTKHPKSVEVFSHRKWLLNHLVQKCPILQNIESDQRGHTSSSLPNCYQSSGQGCPGNSNGHNNYLRHIHLPTAEVNSAVHNTLLAELETCTVAASKYPCNYYAWNHRIWVMKHCLRYSYTVLLSELSWSKSWIQQHISDHSCFQYRQFLLKQLSTYQKHRCSFPNTSGSNAESESVSNPHINGCSQLPIEDPFLAEISLISTLIQCYPGHETLWYHRRFIFHSLTCSAVHQNDQMNCQIESVNEANSQYLQKCHLNYQCEMSLEKLVDGETKFAEQELKSPESFQRHLAKRYIDWVKNFFPT